MSKSNRFSAKTLPEAPLPRAAPGAPISVLLVDDDQLFTRTVLRQFRRYPTRLKPVAVTNVDAAVQQLESRRFDVVLTDLNMRGDVWQLLASINERYPRTVTAMVSGHISPDDIKRCTRLGVGHLTKPFRWSQLETLLDVAIAVSRSRKTSGIEPRR